MKSKTEENYVAINKHSWNNRVDSHLKSKFYEMEQFLKGKSSLNDIELKLLGNVKDKNILHLQCHFGQDSISLARLSAKVTGVDLSDQAIKVAKELAGKERLKVDFICCNIYDLPNNLDGKFDIVYTSYGVINWLPDLDKWAKIISHFLKPNGKFILVEFHPMVWMFDDDFEKIKYDYFNTGAICEEVTGTYANKNDGVVHKTVSWNHSLSDIINSLLKNGLELNSFDEFNYSPYNCFENTVELEPKKYRIKQLDKKIPMIFSIQASNK